MKVGDEYVLVQPKAIGCVREERGTILRVIRVYNEAGDAFVTEKVQRSQSDKVNVYDVHLLATDEDNGNLIKLKERQE